MARGPVFGILTAHEASVHHTGLEEERRALPLARGPASREVPPMHVLLTVNKAHFLQPLALLNPLT